MRESQSVFCRVIVDAQVPEIHSSGGGGEPVLRSTPYVTSLYRVIFGDDPAAAKLLIFFLIPDQKLQLQLYDQILTIVQFSDGIRIHLSYTHIYIAICTLPLRYVITPTVRTNK